ncbi:MAG TPA: copper resistance protein CopC [Ktedonobacteraceae bacterium]|nr:copper resistance protein CopC [Ktedonobacteraceae bacterium]
MTGRKSHLLRVSGLAFLCAFALTLLLPSLASALPLHAILLTSNPAKDAVLRTPPTQVQLWFSEDLNPTLSTVQVINAERQRVDQNNAHVNAGNTKEMDISLQASLQPDVYIVVWRTDSADDGHVLLGSFLFTVANPDGSVPQLSPGANPGQGLLGNTSASTPGTLDAPTLFNFLMVTLVELAATFWVAGQLWVNFVLQSSAEKHPEELHLNRQIERRFERRFSLPALGVLLLANLGVLYGQVLTLTGNNWGSALSFQLLSEQASSGRFGTYWLVRMAVILLALLIGLYMLLSKNRPHLVNQALPLVNLFLGALLFLALTMSGHAAAVNALFLPYSVVLDWLHLLASALWVGGMLYILLIYLPLFKALPQGERARSLLAILPQFSILALAGVVLMAITGPLNATFHLTSIEQFVTTAYGRTLAVKIVLVCALLSTSAFHVGWLRPRLKKEYQKYTYVRKRLEQFQARANSPVEAGQDLELVASTAKDGEERASKAPAQASEAPVDAPKLLVQQAKLREQRLAKKTGLMTRVLRWEPWLGVAIIVCVGLMNVFASTLTYTTPAVQQNNPGVTSAPFNGSAKTSDGKYNVTLNVNPNRFGTNVFTVHVTDAQSGQQLGANQAGVVIYTTMLDMAMGTDSVNLQPDGKGGFSGSGDLSMGGDWDIQVQIRTLDNTLHKTDFKIYAPF